MAPLYLAGNARLRRDVAQGALLTLDDIEDYDTGLRAAWEAGRAARPAEPRPAARLSERRS